MNLYLYIPLAERAGLRERKLDQWPIVVGWPSKLRRQSASHSIASIAEPGLGPVDPTQRPANACSSRR